MKIFFERTGGFAGMKLAINLDLDSMPAADAQSLQKLIDDADLFNIPEPEVKPGIPDSFQYTITVEQRGVQRKLEMGESALPKALQPLISDLSLRARSRLR